jgi:hypothetical protein
MSATVNAPLRPTLAINLALNSLAVWVNAK